MELRPGVEPVPGLANGKQRFVAAAFIDGLTPDVQKTAGLLGRKHAPGTLH
jgi:hypothetical protein